MSLPGPTMRALVVSRFGGPEVLEVRELPTPVAGPGEVVVRVEAAGVCYHDLLDRAGRLPGGEPGRVLGHEVAGEVVEVGPPAGRPAGAEVRPGTRVVAYHRLYCGRCRHCLSGRHDLCRRSAILGSQVDGGYAEYVRLPATNAIPLPDGLPWVAAALAVCPIATTVRAVIGVGGVKPGDTVVVTGASGGLGLHQVALCRQLGARVIAVTGSPGKVEGLRATGADEVVLAADGRFSAAVWAATGKQGADVVLDNVVSGTLGEALRALGPCGLAVVTGNVRLDAVELDPGLVIGRRLRLAGSGNPTFEDVTRALHLLATGRIEAQVDAVLPFEQAAEAHRRLESRSVRGRLVLSGW